MLAALEFDPKIKAAMNIKFSDEILDICQRFGWRISLYDRSKEPPEIKRVEGRTTAWGAEYAIKALGEVPDIIYHRGDWGKEPMIIVLGRDAVDVANKILRIANALLEKDES